MPVLVATAGPLKGHTYTLQPLTIIGRAFDADIRIDDLTVSRHHCQISASRNVYLVEDLGSGNGTYVNEELIARPTALKEGDIVTVSENVFRFGAMSETTTGIMVVDEEEPSDPGSSIVQTLDMRSTLVGGRVSAEEGPQDTLDKAHQRLQTIVEVGNALGGQLQRDKLLNEILDCLFRVFPQMDRGFVMLKDEGSDEMSAAAARQRDQTEMEQVTVSRHIINEAVDRRIAILSADAMGDQRFSAAMSVMNFQIRSMMCAPLITGENVIGVIHVDTTQQDKRFTLDDLELFTAVTNQTALALGNARMHERLMKRERMERDLELARRVQHSFLPGEPPKAKGIEFASTYQAALEVGGDFYDFIPLSGDRLAIVLGDVAGKGIPAALMMARMMSDVRFLALTEPEAGRVLARLNDGVINRSTEDAFVTVVFMILDIRKRELSIANAAHCPPVLRKARTGEIVEVDTQIGFPIAAMPDTEYHREVIALDPGDTITLFSDGVTEALNADGDLFGSENVLRSIAPVDGPPSDVLEAVLKSVSEHVGDTPQSDDLTIVSIGAV